MNNEDNFLYTLQKKFCEDNRVPCFASTVCNHTYKWVKAPTYGHKQTLTEMLIQEHGEVEAMRIASSTHIISCPVCSRSWCD